MLLAVPALTRAHRFIAQDCSQLSPQEQIRYTLATENFILDTKNYAGLLGVYTSDAVVSWIGGPAAGEVWSGIDDIMAHEVKSLDPYTTMHQSTSSLIELYNNGTANITTYAMWNHFGGSNPGYVWQAWAKYLDYMVVTQDGWRVQNRTVVTIAGPLTINMTVV